MHAGGEIDIDNTHRAFGSAQHLPRGGKKKISRSIQRRSLHAHTSTQLDNHRHRMQKSPRLQKYPKVNHFQVPSSFNCLILATQMSAVSTLLRVAPARVTLSSCCPATTFYRYYPPDANCCRVPKTAIFTHNSLVATDLSSYAARSIIASEIQLRTCNSSSSRHPPKARPFGSTVASPS